MLEQLAFAFEDCPPTNLEAVVSISQTLTEHMRRHVARSLQARVNVNYGLNEFGLVASICPEGGRYHVFTECCLIEIVDEHGEPCVLGQVGRVLLTSVINVAMPLIRYDTEDLAEVVAGPCPCGRTLPSFGPIQGRYRRIAYLPPGTWQQWIALQRRASEE